MMEADALLDSMPAALKKTGAWHVMKLSFAMQMRRAAGRWRTSIPVCGCGMASMAVFTRQQSIYRCRSGVVVLLMSSPWCGTPTTKRKPTKVLPGTQLCTRTLSRAAADTTLRDSKVNWTLMKNGFRDALGKPGTDEPSLQFAEHGVPDARSRGSQAAVRADRSAPGGQAAQDAPPTRAGRFANNWRPQGDLGPPTQLTSNYAPPAPKDPDVSLCAQLWATADAKVSSGEMS
mgnify:CR=1 FL=1